MVLTRTASEVSWEQRLWEWDQEKGEKRNRTQLDKLLDVLVNGAEKWLVVGDVKY